jgi:hypothetical protein
MILEMDELKRKKYSKRYHKTLEEGVKKKKIGRNSRTGKGGGYSSTQKKDIQDRTSKNITTN